MLRFSIRTISSAVLIAVALLSTMTLQACSGEIQDSETKSQKEQTSDTGGSKDDSPSVLDSDEIRAVYHGSTEAGTMIDDRSSFNVYRDAPDGRYYSYDNWRVLNPGALPADGVKTYKIECGETVVEVDIEITPKRVEATGTPKPIEYEEVDIDEIHAMAERPYGKRIRFSFMVERIYETTTTTEAIYGYDGIDPNTIFIMSKALGDQINDHTEVTIEGVIVDDDASEHAGAHSMCVKVSSLTVDSRELEQYVKPNQVSPDRKQ